MFEMQVFERVIVVSADGFCNQSTETRLRTSYDYKNIICIKIRSVGWHPAKSFGTAKPRGIGDPMSRIAAASNGFFAARIWTE